MYLDYKSFTNTGSFDRIYGDYNGIYLNSGGTATGWVTGAIQDIEVAQAGTIPVVRGDYALLTNSGTGTRPQHASSACSKMMHIGPSD